MKKPCVLLLGKVPPPYIGPAVATEILLRSGLNGRYRLVHLDTNVHDALDTLGRWGLGKVWKNAALYARLARLLRAERPDLVWIPISQTTLGFAKDAGFIALARLFGRTTMLQLRGSNLQGWLAGTSPPVRRAVEACLRSAQGVVVLGENLRGLFAGYFPPERIFVVPNGADYDLPPRRAEAPGLPRRVLYLANLLPTKGIEDVVEAAGLLRARTDVPFRLDAVGAWADEATKARCLALAEEGGADVRFHAPATGPDKLRLLVEADAFVFPPRAPEGHPWVLVEAMAAGLPIVTTDQGAIRESVEDGTNGFLVEPRRPDQIADRLARLFADPEAARRMGAASRARYLEGFTETRMVDRLARAIDALLGRTQDIAQPVVETDVMEV